MAGGVTGAAGGTSTDFTNTATGAINNAQGQALANIAQSGTQGQAALQNAAQQNAASKTAAIQNAMAYAALRGAPQGNAQGNAATVADPYNARSADLSMLQGIYGANTAAQSGANKDYFQGLIGALPAEKTALDQTVSNDRTKLAQTALNDQLSLQGKELANQLGQLKIAQASGGLGSDPASVIKANGGASLFGQTLAAQAQAQAAKDGIVTFNNPQGYDQVAGEVGAAYGLDPATVEAMIGGSQTTNLKNSQTETKNTQAISGTGPTASEKNLVRSYENNPISANNMRIAETNAAQWVAKNFTKAVSQQYTPDQMVNDLASTFNLSTDVAQALYDQAVAQYRAAVGATTQTANAG